MKGVRHRLPQRLPPAVATVIVTVLILTAGCGATTDGTPSEIIKKAIDAQSKLKSVHVDVATDIEVDAPGGSRSTTISYKGDYEKPDRWKLDIRTSGAKSQVVVIGDRSWVKGPGATDWEEKRTDTRLGGLQPGDMVSSKYLSSAKNVELVDRKNGMYHLKFDLELLSFARAFSVPGVDPLLYKGKDAQMEVWVDRDNLYLASVRLEFAAHFATPMNTDVKMSTEMEFSDFDEPVSIEPPV